MDASKTSPMSPHYDNVQNKHYYNVTSPSNSDGNHYSSPVVSPGYWNNASPAPNTVSPQSNGSFQGSPNSHASKEVRSSPPSSPPSSFQAPALPARLGNQPVNTMSQKIMGSKTNQFLEKSSMDQEREKIANRRAQSLMIKATRKETREYEKTSSNTTFGKYDAKAFLVPCGAEAFATSSRIKTNKVGKEPPVMEDLMGSVNDFKNGFNRDREWAAKKHALRIISKLDNAC